MKLKMDVIKLLKNVVNLDEYTTATHDLSSKGKNLKIGISMDTILTLKNLGSLEIEYLNKCNENGAACIMLELLLTLPPSGAWGILAKEVVILLHYWLEAIRKHLIYHSAHWWMFLRLVMSFIKGLSLKDSAIIPDMVVEQTAECWFALATDSKPDVYQKHEIVHSFNTICADSGREIRFALRNKLSKYFVKIAGHMLRSGYLPGQFSMLECLMRWMVPRQDLSLRAAAAEKWLPIDLCPSSAKELFLNSIWKNFYQDARNFMNALNERSGLVRSMILRQLTIGSTVVINGTEKEQSWLDFNTFGKSMSVLLVPNMLEKIGVKNFAYLFIDKNITKAAQLRKEALGLTISLSLLRAPSFRPIDISACHERQLTIVLSSRTDLRVLDTVMSHTFGEKYQPPLNVDTDVSLSPQHRYSKVTIENQSEEDTRFSNPPELNRKRLTGYTTKSRKPGSHVSSTESTSSLLELKNKLTALPWLKFDKCQPSACAQPSLSHVSEITEIDNCSLPTTDQKTTTDTKCRSDGDIGTGNNRTVSPILDIESEPNYCSVATDSTSYSKFKKTKKRISKPQEYRDDNIVDQLLQEALEAGYKKKSSQEVLDTAVNIDDKNSQESCDNIDDTSNEVEYTGNNVFKPVKKCTVVSKTTTDDDSNTETVNIETPFIRNCKQKPAEVKNIEEFFSQHQTENVITKVLISPSLALKINETNSDISEHFDDHVLLLNDDVNSDVEQSMFNDIEVIDCLNDMVDKVCSEFDKCSEYLYKGDIANIGDVNESKLFKEKRVKTSKAEAKSQKANNNKTQKSKPARNVKKRATKKVAKIITKKMSTIIEQKENDTTIEETCVSKKTKSDDVLRILNSEKKTEINATKVTETLLVRRKRKLYSPKYDASDDKTEASVKESSDDALLSELAQATKNTNTPKTTTTCYKEVEKDVLESPQVRRKRKLYSPKYDASDNKTVASVKESSDDALLSELVQVTKKPNTPITTATCYKELEEERRKNIRLPRTRKSKAKVFDATSPRTLKMNSVFDNLRQNVENNEKITLVDKNADVFNFTSESEDEDFKKKKKHINKQVRSFGDSVGKKTKYTRHAKKSDISCDDAKDKVVKSIPTKRATRKTAKFSNELEKEAVDLVDEKMRDANRYDMLNSSIPVENSINLEPECLAPVIQAPELEEICDSDDYTLTSKKEKNQVQLKKNKSNVSKTKKHAKETTLIHSLSESNDDKKVQRTKTNKVDTHDEPYNDTTNSKKTQRAKKTKILAIKKEKGLSNKTKTLDKDNDGTISPLPGLVVESIPKRKEDINDSLTTNMLNKFRRIHRDGPDITDSTLTQNMLSDVEKNNYSPQNCTITAEAMDMDMKTKITGKKRQQIKEKPKKNKKPIALIEILDDVKANDNLSDRSIATDGIQAHGDLDEAPPTANTIKESYEPRELHDLNDTTMKDYFSKLNSEINRTSSEKSEQDESMQCKVVSQIMSQTNTSPEVLVQCLSNDGIDRWMPSKRTSEYTLQSNPTVKNTNSVNNSKSKHTPNTSAKSGSKSMSPTVVLPRMSLEEFNKWLPIPDSLENKNSPTRKTRNICCKKDAKKPQVATPLSNSKTLKRVKPLISPIPNILDRSFKKEGAKKETLKDINAKITKEDTIVSVDSVESHLPIEAKKMRIEPNASHKVKSVTVTETRRLEPDIAPKQKIQILEDVTLASSRSVSSVKEWLMGREFTEKAAPITQRDAIQCIMEKVDTTLVETNRNTSKMFVDFFMAAQERLELERSKEVETNRQLAAEVQSEIVKEASEIIARTKQAICDMAVKLTDRMFAELNRRSQAAKKDFMESLKKDVLQVIREDCKQKRAMVTLLREDVQAVNDYINRKGTPDSQ